ncbi:hypothetical protein K525DRAFT_275269 [Schizophyllum commune Loenen D]|nr:hypothetical protein K525DRAFT_275269 [Schizophyllum commune Loenen D]
MRLPAPPARALAVGLHVLGECRARAHPSDGAPLPAYRPLEADARVASCSRTPRYRAHRRPVAARARGASRLTRSARFGTAAHTSGGSSTWRTRDDTSPPQVTATTPSRVHVMGIELNVVAMATTSSMRAQPRER